MKGVFSRLGKEKRAVILRASVAKTSFTRAAQHMKTI